MNVFPHYQLRPALLGESRVYDLLAEVNDPHGFAVYSVNLPEHEYKRWAEADFVVVNRAGLTLLEVKGGTVSLTGREWQYQNARGRAIVSAEGPAKQAISAAVALENLLTQQLGRKIRCRWGVVFPLCRFVKAVAELPASRLADQPRCQDVVGFADWLNAIPFDQHGPAQFALSDDEIERIREVLLPEFTATTTLGLALRSTEQQIIRLTAQQFTVLECLHSNARLMVSGGAGTGKTELAVLCARAEQSAGRSPAIVTGRSRFSESLAWKVRDHGIPVLDSALPPGIDTLIVDEGQDYANEQSMRHLFDQLPGGISKGRWRWFMDPNLQFIASPPDPSCIELLAEHSAAVALKRNVRSTREIVGTIRSLLNADVGLSEIDGFGIKVEFHEVRPSTESNTAAQLVIELLDRGVLPRDVAVLGAGGGSGPVCTHMLAELPQVLRKCSPENPPHRTGYGLVSSINEFRGMEARVVILVDLDLLSSTSNAEAELYIGMSRASAALHIFVTPEVKSVLREIARKNFMGAEG
jgi:hypothetical protein